MMIRHCNMGRQAELGPDWQPSAIVTMAKANSGFQKKPIPGLTASAPQLPPAPAARAEQAPPAAPAPSQTPERSSMQRSGSNPNIRNRNAMQWASQRRGPSTLQASGAIQLGDSIAREETDLLRQAAGEAPAAPPAPVRLSAPDLSSEALQESSPMPKRGEGTVHWRTNEMSLSRDSFNTIVSRTRYDPTETLMRDASMSRQVMCGPGFSPSGLQTRDIARKISPLYGTVPYAG